MVVAKIGVGAAITCIVFQQIVLVQLVTGRGPVNIRYRFNDGVASRGKLTGRHEAVTLSYIKIETPKGGRTPTDGNGCEIDMLESPTRYGSQPNIYKTQAGAQNVQKNVADSERYSEDLIKITPFAIDYPLDHLDFSDHAAQITTVINLGFNGYRDLILPQAESEPLIRKALISIAEQHLSLQVGLDISWDPTAYGSLVRDLVKRSNQVPAAENELAMAVILLLHLREIISRGDDFKLIYGSLRIIVHGILDRDLGGTGSQLEEFVRTQILREIDVYVDILGQHLLAWSYFVVAAESSIPSHQSFFLDRLSSLYRVTGCGNILKAVEQIQKMWEVRDKKNDKTSGVQGAAQVAALARAGHDPIAVSRNLPPLAIDGVEVKTTAAYFGDEAAISELLATSGAEVVFLNLPSTSFHPDGPVLAAAASIGAAAHASPSVRLLVFNTSMELPVELTPIEEWGRLNIPPFTT
ncbi:hypothetical protein BX600DRAFT_442924 [Xylariales sp. PMI_506]|nr:hypothetical protein BX600DRAFT_442924 [Xylariales sp. PMI_506]